MLWLRKSKKKKTKKRKDEEPKEPQYDSFFDVPADNGQTFDAKQSAPQPSGDLLSGDWWQQDEADPFGSGGNGQGGGGGDDDEFGWFQNGSDAVNIDESGVGEDGGAFGFGNEEDFADDKKQDETLDADGWMTSLTTMDNVLDGSVQKKDPNKRNLKGKSMAAMASSNPMPTSFGTDDFFNTNSGGNAMGNSNNSGSADSFDPFGMSNNTASNNDGVCCVVSLCIYRERECF